MYLYHGTSAAAVPNILKNGIMPRQDSGIAANSGLTEYQGHAECVYLANGYASYYAGEAVNSPGGFTGEAAILEIDTDLLNNKLFLPDDFVIAEEMSIDPNNAGVPFENFIKTARSVMTDYNDLWKASLHNMGTCAYRGIIPPNAIKRVSYVDFQKMESLMLFEILDISVSSFAYLRTANKYKMVEAWFWGGKVEFGFDMAPKERISLSYHSIQEFEQLWQDRSSVRIESCPSYKKGSD